MSVADDEGRTRRSRAGTDYKSIIFLKIVIIIDRSCDLGVPRHFAMSFQKLFHKKKLGIRSLFLPQRIPRAIFYRFYQNHQSIVIWQSASARN